MRYDAENLTGIDLGRQGENLARTVEIDVSAMLAQWPEATISLLVKRNHDPCPYVANTEVRDGVLYWPITAADTAIAGDGKLELRAMCGEVLAKSVMGTTRIAVSLTGNETQPPSAAQGWVEQVVEAGREAQVSAESAHASAEMLSGIRAEAKTLPPGSEATVTVEDGRIIYGIPRGDPGGGEGGGSLKLGNGLTLSEDGALSVQTTNDAEQDNTLPMTSAGVYTQLGNITILLGTI